jgi:cysteine synthase
MTICQNIVEAIGNTPLIKLRRASQLTGCTILGKAEFMNPGQSVKDRAALFIIRAAEKSGALKPGGTIVEGTAGNTGIGLAMVANALGYRTVIVIPETQAQEKKDALRQMGAELIEVPAVPYRNPNNYVKYSGRLAAKIGAVWANQFDNVANRQAHIETTAPEIWEHTNGKVDGFCCAVGFNGAESQEQEHQNCIGGPDGVSTFWPLQKWRIESRRLLHHGRHRTGPHHRQS